MIDRLAEYMVEHHPLLLFVLGFLAVNFAITAAIEVLKS